MSIGYACLNIGTPGTKMRSVMQRNATAEKLTEVTAHNLAALEKMIDYNRENNIKLFRISSDLIPFGSSPVNEASLVGYPSGGIPKHRGEDREERDAGVLPSGAIYRPELAG